MDKNQSNSLLNTFRFPWSSMDVLVGGTSAIDLEQLHFNSLKEAGEFVSQYGFDLKKPSDKKRVQALIIESLAFLEKYLMPNEWAKGLMPPNEVLLCDDPRQLLLWASGVDCKSDEWRAWSCAILRVLHTLVHIDGVWALTDTRTAYRQIRSRFQQFLFKKGNELFLGDQSKFLAIEKIEWKPQKSRVSILMKLLHKPANVAETIYDLFGVRIITKSTLDIMVCLKFLRDFHLIAYPNCIPSRSRNSVVDFDCFKKSCDELQELYSKNKINEEGFIKELQKCVDMSLLKVKTKNPHSAISYRSIQLTCRQMIRQKNNWVDWESLLVDLTKHYDDLDDQKLSGLVKSMREVLKNSPTYTRTGDTLGFFPFEVQIMDLEGFREAKFGDASHVHYKKSQFRAARRRVLSGVLKLK